MCGRVWVDGCVCPRDVRNVGRACMTRCEGLDVVDVEADEACDVCVEL